MIELIVRYGQTIFDVCIWKYGTLQEISRLVRDNGVNYDQAILQGDTLLINSSLDIGRYQVRLFFQNARFIPVSNVDNVRELKNFIFLDGTNNTFLDGTNFIFLG